MEGLLLGQTVLSVEGETVRRDSPGGLVSRITQHCIEPGRAEGSGQAIRSGPIQETADPDGIRRSLDNVDGVAPPLKIAGRHLGRSSVLVPSCFNVERPLQRLCEC
jgi:hypothetical protein